MSDNKEPYADTADKLTDVILGLIPTNPSILEMGSPWDLFKIEGFRCEDIQPSLFQAGWALANAKRIYELNQKGD